MTFGQIQPMGWLKDQMLEDIRSMITAMDSLSPVTTAAIHRFGEGQFPKKMSPQERTSVEASLVWWNGLIEQAILTRDQQLLQHAGSYIDRQIQHQAADGYLGVFDPDRRYLPEDFNTECYTKALLLSGLLKWSIHTGDRQLLQSIQSAIQNTSLHLPATLDDPIDPLTSGLTLVDVLFELYHLTGQTIHQDLIDTLLHRAQIQPRSSIREFATLKGPDRAPAPFYYSAPRWLTAGAALTNDPRMRQDLAYGMEQISRHQLPSGAIANPSLKDKAQQYHFEEVRAILETYVFLLQASGDPVYAEAIERLYLNAVPGMFADHHDGLVCPQAEDHTAEPARASDHAISHSTTQSCEAGIGHIHPTYMESLWFQDGQGFVNSCFAPCELNSRWGSRYVRIQEMMDFPGDYRVRINIQTDSACTFMVKVRKPKWARAITINQPYTLVGDFIHIEKEWSGFDEISLVFAPGVSNYRTATGRRWYTFGPLVLASKRPSPQEQSSASSSGLALPEYYTVKPADKPKRAHGSHAEDLRFSLLARRSDNQQEETIRLVPIGQTTTRQSTFPEYRP